MVVLSADQILPASRCYYNMRVLWYAVALAQEGAAREDGRRMAERGCSCRMQCSITRGTNLVLSGRPYNELSVTRGYVCLLYTWPGIKGPQQAIMPPCQSSPPPPKNIPLPQTGLGPVHSARGC